MPILKTDIREVPQEEVAAKLAILRMTGVGINKCVQLLSEEFCYNFTRTQLKRLEHKDVYVRTVKEYKDNVVKRAIADLKEGTARLVPKIITAIEKSLAKGSTAAIPPALKILGIEGTEPENKQAQAITVIMPGSKKPESLTVTKDTYEMETGSTRSEN